MNIINENGLDARQIVPEDFHFLSQADQQVVTAMEYLVRTLAGFPVRTYRNAIILSQEGNQPGFRRIVISSYIYYIPKGVLIHKGKIYELENWNSDSYAGYCFLLKEEVVQPSPVFGPDSTSQPTVNCHIGCRASVVAQSDVQQDDTTLSFDEVYCLFETGNDPAYQTVSEALQHHNYVL